MSVEGGDLSERQRQLLGIFQLQQKPFHWQATTKAGQAAVATDHTMTGDDDWYRVTAIGTADRPGCFRVADCVGDIAIADCVAVGYFLKVLPYLLLKPGARRLKWYVEGAQFSIEVQFQLPAHFRKGCPVLFQVLLDTAFPAMSRETDTGHRAARADDDEFSDW